MRGETTQDLVPAFLWEDLTVEQFYRPERLNHYILISGKYEGTRWDWVVGPFDDEQPENVLEHAKKTFLTSVFPNQQRLNGVPL